MKKTSKKISQNYDKTRLQKYWIIWKGIISQKKKGRQSNHNYNQDNDNNNNANDNWNNEILLEVNDKNKNITRKDNY